MVLGSGLFFFGVSVKWL